MKKLLFLLIAFFAINLHSQGKIKRIEFNTEGYASAPDFDLIIYSDRTTIFNARSDNYTIPLNGNIVGYGNKNKGVNIRESEVKGLFVTKLKKKVYKEVVDLVRSLDEEFDKKTFTSNTLHNSVGKLKVVFSTGKIESVYDGGLNGTEDLLKLYDYLKVLRFNQEWN